MDGTGCRHATAPGDGILVAPSGCYSYLEIAEFFGIHLATVGRVIRQAMLQCETPSSPYSRVNY
jgi:hypothetical protein